MKTINKVVLNSSKLKHEEMKRIKAGKGEYTCDSENDCISSLRCIAPPTIWHTQGWGTCEMRMDGCVCVGSG